MMMLSEITKAVGGKLRGADVLCTSVGTNSKNIVLNQLFIAIKGERFDGNTFAQEAIKAGAAASLISTDLAIEPSITVFDTRIALGKLAQHWRKKFDIPLVAITGSNGKTTTKEMLAAILNAANHRVLATQGNLNNDIGMPMTLLQLRAEHTVAVIEMGMNHLGEIAYLTHLACPKVALVNNAGTAHIGELGSRENIAKAKGEIYASLDENGVAVINADDDFADYWKSLNKNKKTITFGLKKQADITATHKTIDGVNEVNLVTNTGEVSFKLSMLGTHNISNALAASAAAVALGVSNADIARGLTNMQPVQGRLQRKAGHNKATVIDDTYNANPDSMKAAIDVLARCDGSRIFVMGDMAELGADAANMHAEIGTYAKQQGIQHFYALGDLSMYAANAFGAGAQHFGILKPLSIAVLSQMHTDVTVLVKGSRFMQMERLVNEIVVNEIVLIKKTQESH